MREDRVYFNCQQSDGRTYEAGMRKDSRRIRILYLSILAAGLWLASSPSAAVLSGRVFDQETSRPLQGASIVLAELPRQAATDSAGFCWFDGIPAGTYSLYVSFVGYRSDTIRGILVGRAETTFVEAGLLPQPIPGPDIVVRSRQMPYREELFGGSRVSLTRAEITEAAGVAGDLVRSFSILPGVARYDDRYNSLVIRGGSPIENGIWIDFIPLPSLNHFSASGTTGGVISLINADLLHSTTIYLAGFPAAYPDHLSSIWDIRLREGNRQRAALQLEAGVSGFEIVAETPIMSGQGSLLWSVRRSFLELILKAMDIDVIPKFWDTHGKLAVDIDSSNHIDLIFLYGSSEAKISTEATSLAPGSISGGTEVSTATTGIHWRRRWHARLHSDVSLGYSDSRYDNRSTLDDFNDALYSNRATERSITAHFRNSWTTSNTVSLDFGWSVRRHFGWYEYDFEDRWTPIHDRVKGLNTSRTKHEWRLGSYISGKLNWASRMWITFGLRSDYLTRNSETVLSPRSSIRVKLNSQTSLTASVGLYHQPLPGILAYQQESFEHLTTPKAKHLTVGLSRMIGHNLSLKLEAYDKQYFNQPMYPGRHFLYVLDDLVERYGHFNSYDTLVDNGKAHSRGVELLLRGNVLQSRLQFLIGGAVSSMEYRDSDGAVYNRVVDNAYTFGLESRYHITEAWAVSLRWNLAGGTPYTPFDIAESRRRNLGVLDTSRFLDERLPDYQSLNVRVQHSFQTGNSQLIIHFSIWNLYDHRNVAGYYWSKETNSPKALRQLGFFPLGGIKVSF